MELFKIPIIIAEAVAGFMGSRDSPPLHVKPLLDVLPCAPHCTMAKAALYNVINAERTSFKDEL